MDGDESRWFEIGPWSVQHKLDSSYEHSFEVVAIPSCCVVLSP